MPEIKYERIHQGKYKYKLLAAYVHPTFLPETTGNEWLSVDRHGDLFLAEGYCWDGASGPTIDSPATMRGSLVRDGCYQLMREHQVPRAYRGYADRLLRDICIEDGMDKCRAWTWYWMVRTFAGFAVR